MKTKQRNSKPLTFNNVKGKSFMHILIISIALLFAIAFIACGGGGGDGGGGAPLASGGGDGGAPSGGGGGGPTSVNLPKTGQTTCYNAAGTVIACANTGQDGNLKRGVAWPSPRFTDNGNGTVADNLTGLMWTKDANAPGPAACAPATAKTWQGALDYVACLNANNYLGYTDWRLPNRKELRSLINYESGINVWLNGQGFSNVQADHYWSSSTSAGSTTDAWVVDMDIGYVVDITGNKTGTNYVWPVRAGGGGATADLPKTGQTTSYAAGDDGDLEKGVAWPSPRFTVDGTGFCVTDNLTGLMWVRTPLSTLITWANALTYANILTLCGYDDWRLPNVNELESLINAEQANNAAWLNGQGFSNVQADDYWSSSTYLSWFLPSQAWYVDMGDGSVNFFGKPGTNYVWPVRAGGTTADLPKTGQTTCYNAAGTVIACANTGQDGELQRGATWPSPRFTVDGTGFCVTDNLTGLMWVRTPDSTTRLWADALTYANGLTLCGYSDWRLPNRKELRSLINYGQANSAAWLNTQGFSNVSVFYYWSSSTIANDTTDAWGVRMYLGEVDAFPKDFFLYVWPVRAGGTTADLPKTGQTTSYAAGDDGDLEKGVAWPSTRFTVDGTGFCVTDNLTGLMWVRTPDSTTRLWADALTYANGLTLCGYDDWRLPNVNEHESLINAEQANTATWLNTQGFSNVQAGLYWSSSNRASGATSACYVNMYGGVSFYGKGDTFYVWPVRAGQ